MAVDLDETTITDPDDEDVSFDLAETFSEEFTGAIVYCPVCCTAGDAESWGSNVIECNNCESKYVVHLDPNKVAAYAPIG